MSLSGAACWRPWRSNIEPSNIERPERAREYMSSGLLETLFRDLRYAVRTMRQSPVFSATAVLTLALAIGGNTAMFTVIRAVLLKPLDYRDPERLVRITGGATPA